MHSNRTRKVARTNKILLCGECNFCQRTCPSTFSLSFRFRTLKVCAVFASCCAYAWCFVPAPLLLHLILMKSPVPAWICFRERCAFDRVGHGLLWAKYVAHTHTHTQSDSENVRKSRTQNNLETYKHLNIQETAHGTRHTLMHFLRKM